MKSSHFRSSLVLFLLHSLILLFTGPLHPSLAQEEAGTFCISEENVVLHSCPDQDCPGNMTLGAGVRMNVVGTVEGIADDAEIWSVIQEPQLGTGYVLDLTCIPMEVLWSEAQPLIDEYTSAIQLNPNDVESLTARGQQYLDLGEYDSALADFETAIQIAPDYGAAYGGRVLSYVEMGRLPDLLATLMPRQHPPEDRYDAALGTTLFDKSILENGAAYSDNQWNLVMFPYFAYVVVPSGWRTVLDYDRMMVDYSSIRNYDEPDFRLILGVTGYEGDDRTSAEVAMELEERYTNRDHYAILTSALIDEHSGYFVMVYTADTGKTYDLVLGFSESLNMGWFHLAYAMTPDHEQWERYFPVIQTILANLYTADFAPAPIRLPKSLIDLESFAA